MFVIAVMVKNAAGENIGVLGNNVLLDTISQITSNVKIGKSGYAWICDDETTILAHPVPEARMKLNLKTTDDLKYMKENAHKIIEQESASFEVENLNKVKVVIYTKKIPNTPNWAFGVSVPKKELYEQANKIAILIFSITLLSFLIIVGISYVVAKNIANPIGLAADFANNMAKHKYNKYIGEKYSKRTDEIGILAESFNTLVESMVDTVTELKKSSESVASSSTEMSSQMAIVAEGALTQNERKNELESKLNENKNTNEELNRQIAENQKILEEQKSELIALKSISDKEDKKTDRKIEEDISTLRESLIETKKELERVKKEKMVADKLNNSNIDLPKLEGPLADVMKEENKELNQLPVVAEAKIEKVKQPVVQNIPEKGFFKFAGKEQKADQETEEDKEEKKAPARKMDLMMGLVDAIMVLG